MSDILDQYFNDDFEMNETCNNQYNNQIDSLYISDEQVEMRFCHNKTYLKYALCDETAFLTEGYRIYQTMLKKCHFIDDDIIQSFIDAWINDTYAVDMIGINFSIVVSFYEIFQNEPYTDLFIFKECAVRDYILSCDRQLELIPLKRLLMTKTDLH
jgi:hypothetical protein